MKLRVNTLRPEQNGWYYTHRFKCIYFYMNENIIFWFRFHWSWSRKVQLTNDKHCLRWWLFACLAQVHNLNQWQPSSLIHICITRLQWFKMSPCPHCGDHYAHIETCHMSAAQPSGWVCTGALIHTDTAMYCVACMYLSTNLHIHCLYLWDFFPQIKETFFNITSLSCLHESWSRQVSVQNS